MGGTTAEICRACIDCLRGALSNIEVERSLGDLPVLNIVDLLERLCLWIGSADATQDSKSSSSLEYRLRGDNDVLDRILHLLEAVHEAASDLQSHAGKLGEALNKNELEDYQNLTTTLIEEIESYITRLFRAMEMVHEVSPVDPFIAASQSRQIDEDDQREVDIAYMAKKFPKLASEDQVWLLQRFGRANTHRRQFVRYMQQNHGKIQPGTLRYAYPRHDELRKQAPSSTPPSHSPGGPTTQAINQSSETSIFSRIPDLFKLQVAFQISHESFRPFHRGDILGGSGVDSSPSDQAARSKETDIAHQILRSSDIDPNTWAQDQILQLGNASLMERTRVIRLYRSYMERMHRQARIVQDIECPFCYEVLRVKSEQDWHRHLYQDLRAYICTFRECNMLYFDNVDEWFNHEMKHHRISFQCPICQGVAYDGELQYLGHMRSSHRAVVESGDTQGILQIGKRPMKSISVAECPFCTTWPANEAQTIADAGASSRVSPVDFKGHLAPHLEEVALLSLPIPGSDGHISASVAMSQAVQEGRNERPAQPHRNCETPFTTLAGLTLDPLMVDRSWRAAGVGDDMSTYQWLYEQQGELPAATIHLGEDNDTDKEEPSSDSA